MRSANSPRIPRRSEVPIPGVAQQVFKQPHIGILIINDEDAGIQYFGVF
jgi:hypothetical protein